MINIDDQDKEVSGAAWKIGRMMASEYLDPSAEGTPKPGDVDPELEDAARTEHEYVRQRLLEELGREPTDAEMDEWLRRHTEGY